MDEKRISELNAREKVLEEELRAVRKERREIYDRPTSKINRNKIYRISYFRERDYETDYIGFITDCWFSKTEGCYMVDLCALTCETSDEYCDNAFSAFYGLYQRRISADNINEFVDSLEEMTEEELKSYIKEWLVESEKNIKNWFNYFKNKNYENEEE